MSQKPLISVIMPVYNRSAYVAEAIESILAQTYNHFELLIIDDCSTDNSWDIISGYRKRYTLIIKAFRLKKNLGGGGSGAINFGFKKSSGQFIALMDSDDISHPDRLEKQIQYLLKHPLTIMVGSQVNVINHTGTIIGNKKLPLNHRQIYKQFSIIHPMVPPSCLIRKSLLPTSKRFYEIRFGLDDDYYNSFKFLNCGKFANLKDCFLDYRVHFDNCSFRHLKKNFFNTLKIRLIAIKELRYRPSFTSLLLILPQILIAFLVPEKLISPLYMLARGNYSLGHIKSQINKKVSRNYLKYTDISPSSLVSQN